MKPGCVLRDSRSESFPCLLKIGKVSLLFCKPQGFSVHHFFAGCGTSLQDFFSCQGLDLLVTVRRNIRPLILSLCTHSCYPFSKGMRVKNNLSETSTGLSSGEELAVFVSMSGDQFWLSLAEDLSIATLKTKYFFPCMVSGWKSSPSSSRSYWWAETTWN